MRILSIDGGGIRGLIPALVLVEFERCAGRPIADLFDLIAGTSTGGLLALALTQAGPDGRPRWRADELPSLYETDGPAIFSRSPAHRLRSAEGALEEKYQSGGIDSALRRRFGEARLRDALTDVLVTAYETRMRTPFFFRSARARDPEIGAAYDYPLRDAGRATAAAPTYFEAAAVRNDASGELYSLVDGGVFAVNPAMCAYAEARAGNAPEEELVMVSLGTGEHTRPLPHSRIAGWGALQWVRPLIDVIFDGVSDTVDYQLRQLLPDRERYWRLQTPLDRASDALDDARPANLARLRTEAQELIDTERDAIGEICDRLTGDGAER